MQRPITTSYKQTNIADVVNVDWYTAYSVHEKDEVNLIDATGVNGGGREFYGEILNNKNKSLSISFPLQYVRTDLDTY